MNGSTPVLLGFGGQLAAGALVTAGLAGASLVAGLVLGLVGAGARLSRYRLLRGAGHAYTTAVRGVPEMLVVLLVYFGASAAVRRVAALAGITGYFELSPFIGGVLALSLTFGGLRHRGVARRVPGAAAPADRGGAGARAEPPAHAAPRAAAAGVAGRAAGAGQPVLVLLKDTSLVSVVGLDELMRKSTIAVSYTRQPFTFYFAAALIYLP